MRNRVLWSKPPMKRPTNFEIDALLPASDDHTSDYVPSNMDDPSTKTWIWVVVEMNTNKKHLKLMFPVKDILVAVMDDDANYLDDDENSIGEFNSDIVSFDDNIADPFALIEMSDQIFKFDSKVENVNAQVGALDSKFDQVLKSIS
ncbi:unnamed protein product [Lactuca saligna]|uniref:Uncharacterized protein n=1 Tax=Lactuca saligna TaxID=75948 RepID=A0AA35ZQ58_LACSI|nr:unnamed protein product [Lactuca saligna]